MLNDDESLAQFLESEILSEVLLRITEFSQLQCINCSCGLIVSFQSQDAGEADEPEAKRSRLGGGGGDRDDAGKSTEDNAGSCSSRNSGVAPRRIETGIFSKLPPEIFPHILKFLSSEV